MSEAARARRDDLRYEPQPAVPGHEAPIRDAGPADPLAELARLVGQEDPYRNVFRPPVAEAARGRAVEADRHHGFGEEPASAEEAYVHGSAPHDDGHHRGYDDHQAYDDGHDAHAHHAADESYAQHDHLHAGAGQAAYADEAGLADEGFTAAAGAIPDVWARGEDGHIGAAPEIDHGEDHGHPVSLDRSAARRPIAVLAAVLLLTGGGLAATFLAKGSTAPGLISAGAGRSAPTIMAATGPTKVKVDDGSTTAPEDQDAALLNKSGSASSGPVKIVSSQEQPADLGQLPKTDLADGARPLPPPSGSPFPEPKKVKTFLVHPDGTMLSPDGSAPAPSASTMTTGTVPAPSDETSAAALPATPRTATRGGATPRSATPGATPGVTIASLTADPAVPDAAPAKPTRQDAAPGVRAPSSKPSDTAAAPSAGGSFGLQLASSPVEAEANAIFGRLKKKYPTLLGPYSASIHKFETGDKPMYRVRVGGMSQDDAKTLCTKLESAGGSCYVVRN